MMVECPTCDLPIPDQVHQEIEDLIDHIVATNPEAADQDMTMAVICPRCWCSLVWDGSFFREATDAESQSLAGDPFVQQMKLDMMRQQATMN